MDSRETSGVVQVANTDLAALATRSASYEQAGTRADCAFIVVTGGVLSGLGKGITASSIGRLLKMHALRVTAVKIDPYLNVDAGTMNPFEHGEVFVLEDGGEVDLDLGNYERFLDLDLARENNITTGKAYAAVIEKERRGDFLGKTVQIVPHVVNEIREHVKRVAKKAAAQVCLVEVGGTVGDIESMPFLEAIRQLKREVGRDRLVVLHTTLVPVVGVVGEQKTKPTQHSVRELKGLGIDADAIICRSAQPLEEGARQKISLFCDVPPEAVISAHDCQSIYEVPLLLHRQGLDDWLIDRLSLQAQPAEQELRRWEAFVEKVVNPRHAVNVAIVGKYTHLADSYLSISEAFRHAGASLDTQVKVTWVEATDVEQRAERAMDILASADGILIPGGFGSRGAEGKILAAQFARERHVPYLGICYGFQLALVEFARHVMGLEGAHTTEVAPDTPHPVICILPEQHRIAGLGASMRLGRSDIEVGEGTLAAKLYGAKLASERHRHRYEVNPEYIALFEEAGVVFSGRMPGRPIMEMLELPNHPYFFGGQFHPEFKSRPERPSPAFRGFVEAMLGHQARKERGEAWTPHPPRRPFREALATR